MKWSNGLKRLRKNLGIRKKFLILFCVLLLLSPYGSIVSGLGGAALAETEETAMEDEAGKSEIDAQVEEQEEAQETKEMKSETETIHDKEKSEEDKVNNEEENSLLEQEVEEREGDNEEDAALTKNEQKQEKLLENRIEPSDETIFVHESALDEKEQVGLKIDNISLLKEDIQQFANQSDFETSDNANGVTITEYSGMETDLIIPSEIDGKTVTVIGEEAFKGKGLTKITLPNTVVTIGNGAFQNNDLTNLEIPASIKNIYSHAFADNKLTALVIPDTVESITAYAFSNNEIANLQIGRGLTEIQVGIFRGNKLNHVTIPNNITRITSQAFYLNEIETIAFPETLQEIFGSAFKGNQLTSLSIPASVEVVRDDAFGDNNFGEVTIYNPSTEFQGEVFNGNRGNITIKSFDPSTAKDYATARGYLFETMNIFETSDNPDGTLTITGYNGNDKDLTIPEEIDGKTVTIIGEKAFKGKGLTKITLPDTVVTIRFEAFQNNELTNLDIPPSVKEIYGRAFADNKLTALVIPDTVERLVYYTFTNNEIETLQIGSGLTQIGDGIFRENKLKHVTIPDNITAIRNQAFYINEIETITLPETLQVIEGSAFEDNQLTNISIPASVNKIFYRAFNNNLLDEVLIHNSTMIFEENDIFKDNKTNPADLIIYGHHLSTAQNHATDNNYTFIAFSTVDSVETLGDIEVDFGTLMADITLPIEVEIELADARKLNVPVSWEAPLHYDGEEVGNYIFEGQLDLPDYISNPSNILAKVTVVVKEVPDKEIKDVASIGTMFDVGAKELTEILALLPSKVTVTLDDGFQVDLNVSKWGANSNPVYNKDVAGIYIFNGEIELPAGIANSNDFKATFSISLNEVIVDKKITTSVFASVPLKTGHYEQVDLPLPEKAEVTLSDGSTVELEVEWNPVSSPIYDKDAVGSYRFSGEFKLKDGITNPDKHVIQRDFVLANAIVLVKYLDEYGNVLAPEERLEDKMHMDYTTEAKVIDGYTLTGVPTNASGRFQYNDITVTYVYSKNSTESENLEITAVHLQGIVKEVGTLERADIVFPNTVTVTLADGTQIELGVTNWDTDSEPRYDKRTAGSYIFRGDLELVDGIANSANIRVGYSVTLTDVGEDEKTSKAIRSVPIFGTAFGIGSKDLSVVREYLPTIVELQLEDGSLVELEVKWSENSYPPYEMNTIGTYIFTGEIVLADGITNPEQFTPEYWVNIIDSEEIFEPQEQEESTDHPNVNQNEDSKAKKDKNNLVVSNKKGSKDNGAMISKDNSTKIPKTATSYFNSMLAGLLLSIIGGIIYMTVRKKRIS